MSYEGLQSNTSKNAPHLGGNLIEGDPFTFSPNVWNYVIERFAISSILDLGSGLGHTAEWFFRKGMKVVAADGLEDNIARSIYPTIQLDLTKNAINCDVDLVHCQEVVEHIDELYLENTLRSLACGKFILLTNALPGQGGYNHVNEQNIEYWIRNLARYNCHVLLTDTQRIRSIAQNEGAIYLARTGTLYANRNKL